MGGGGLSSEEIGKGLKEALEVGISKGSDALAQKGGYLNSVYKIMLPPEARAVSDKLKAVPGFNKVEADMIEKLNAAAEDAATRAKPIFVKAITAMTFADALNILMGEKNAATVYLKKATLEALYKEFNPIIVASLDKFGARKYWSDATTAHNKLPFVKKANPDLDDYVTRSALEGLFGMVETKEKDIRQNTGSRTTDLLKKVFAQQDK
ncbi:MAG: DUF4197 domain-containing protein [Saprospiraceae bacterium]|nr:DUF4197 domain-containing protein [Saprospiraceae bacterium]